MKNKRAAFITFEGTEGSGKSTLIQAVARRLEQLGVSVMTTREPGGLAVAESIRHLILNQKMHPMTELLLYEAARAEHLNFKIRPALEKGTWVLCDRFTDSTFAYQGAARGIDWKTIQAANRLATQGLSPDLTVFLDIDPEAGLKSAVDPNKFEAEGIEFQKKVRQGFLKIMKLEKNRFLKMKAKSDRPEIMAEMLVKKILTRFKNKIHGSKKI